MRKRNGSKYNGTKARFDKKPRPTGRKNRKIRKNKRKHAEKKRETVAKALALCSWPNTRRVPGRHDSQVAFVRTAVVGSAFTMIHISFCVHIFTLLLRGVYVCVDGHYRGPAVTSRCAARPTRLRRPRGWRRGFGCPSRRPRESLDQSAGRPCPTRDERTEDPTPVPQCVLTPDTSGRDCRATLGFCIFICVLGFYQCMAARRVRPHY